MARFWTDFWRFTWWCAAFADSLRISTQHFWSLSQLGTLRCSCYYQVHFWNVHLANHEKRLHNVGTTLCSVPANESPAISTLPAHEEAFVRNPHRLDWALAWIGRQSLHSDVLIGLHAVSQPLLIFACLVSNCGARLCTSLTKQKSFWAIIVRNLWSSFLALLIPSPAFIVLKQMRKQKGLI